MKTQPLHTCEVFVKQTTFEFSDEEKSQVLEEMYSWKQILEGAYSWEFGKKHLPSLFCIRFPRLLL